MNLPAVSTRPEKLTVQLSLVLNKLSVSATESITRLEEVNTATAEAGKVTLTPLQLKR